MYTQIVGGGCIIRAEERKHIPRMLIVGPSAPSPPSYRVVSHLVQTMRVESRMMATCVLLFAASTAALQASRPVLSTHRAAPAPAVAMSLKPVEPAQDSPADKPFPVRSFPVAALAVGTLLAFAPSAAHAADLGATGLLAAGTSLVGGADFVPSFSLIFLSEIGAPRRSP